MKIGDVIQTGIVFANGDGSIVWGSHQVIRSISLDGTLWYRPREAKVDKCPQHWRLPIESKDVIIKDLKRWANPKESKEAIQRMNEIVVATDRMTEKLKVKKNHPGRCKVRGCKQKGTMVTLDVMDGSADEFETRLCEKHYKEARSCGQ